MKGIVGQVEEGVGWDRGMQGGDSGWASLVSPSHRLTRSYPPHEVRGNEHLVTHLATQYLVASPCLPSLSPPPSGPATWVWTPAARCHGCRGRLWVQVRAALDWHQWTFNLMEITMSQKCVLLPAVHLVPPTPCCAPTPTTPNTSSTSNNTSNTTSCGAGGIRERWRGEDEYGERHASGLHVTGRIILNLWRIMKGEVGGAGGFKGGFCLSGG